MAEKGYPVYRVALCGKADVGKTSIFRCIRGEEFLDDTSKSPYLAEAEIKVKVNNTTIKVRNVLFLQAKVLVRALSILSCFSSSYETFCKEISYWWYRQRWAITNTATPYLPTLAPSLLNPCARYFFFQFSIERWSFCFPKLGHMTLLFARGFPLDFTKTITIIVLVKSNLLVKTNEETKPLSLA